jgi:hypothetical protein
VTYRLALALLLALAGAAPAHAQLAAAVLPSNLSVEVGHAAIASATIINASSTMVIGCSIAPLTNVPAEFHYVSANPATGAPAGTPNVPFDIPAGGAQTFRITFLPYAVFTNVVVELRFACADGASAPVVQGVNTLNLSALPLPPPPQLTAAILPSGRSVQLGKPATAFATIINAGVTTATGCSITPNTLIPATFQYAPTDPATNLPAGPANSPVDIAAGGAQTFVIAFTPHAEFGNTQVELRFACAQGETAALLRGVNTFNLSASTAPVADVIAVSATTTNDGIVSIPAGGAGAFVVAFSNIGEGRLFFVAVTSHGSPLPGATVCLFSPTGACESFTMPIGLFGTPTPVLSILKGTTGTLGVILPVGWTEPFDPARNRIAVEFREANHPCFGCPLVPGELRGMTGVAVKPE